MSNFALRTHPLRPPYDLSPSSAVEGHPLGGTGDLVGDAIYYQPPLRRQLTPRTHRAPPQLAVAERRDARFDAWPGAAGDGTFRLPGADGGSVRGGGAQAAGPANTMELMHVPGTTPRPATGARPPAFATATVSGGTPIDAPFECDQPRHVGYRGLRGVQAVDWRALPAPERAQGGGGAGDVVGDVGEGDAVAVGVRAPPTIPRLNLGALRGGARRY